MLNRKEQLALLKLELMLELVCCIVDTNVVNGCLTFLVALIAIVQSWYGWAFDYITLVMIMLQLDI